jgi:hypothetical protein
VSSRGLRARLLAIAAAAWCAAPAAAQGSLSAPPGRPDLEPARIAGELMVGAYAGIGGYFAGRFIGETALRLVPTAHERTRDDVAFVTGVLGGGVATAAGVTAIGNIGDQTGSFQASLIGMGAGVLTGVFINQLMYGHARLPRGRESSRMRWLEASLEALLPSVGATIGFNSSRRFK